MSDEDGGQTRWAEVLAKATAMLALQGAKKESRLEEADFLIGLGVTRPEAARMLGVTATTLRNLAHQARNREKGGRNGKGKNRRHG